MKTITFYEKDFTLTLKADDIVATTRSKDKLHIYLRGCDEPFQLNNSTHFDEWYDAIWEDNTI